jgi:multiple sugar transport system substrate-binding protein
MTVDPRIIYYRIDHLTAAGIDPATAFNSAPALANTLARLQAAGVSAPWAVPTHRSRLTVHNLASWIWGAGGRFMTPDIKHTAFASPASLAGISQYFQLARYISAPHRELGDDEASQVFYRGESSVTIAGPWLHYILDFMPAKVGRSLPPGVPFVGGTHLVIWRHARNQRPLLNLISYLTSPTIQLAIYPDSTVLPARPDVLAREPFANDPFYAALASQLQTARSFPLFRLWGMLENRLTEAMATIWRGALEKTGDTSLKSASLQQAAIASLVAETLEPLARRLDITLSS